MNREETLNYLQQKRSETADVAIAQQNLSAAQAKLNKASKKISRTIITFWIIGIVFFLLGLGTPHNLTLFYFDENGFEFGPLVFPFIFGGIAVILMLFKNRHYIAPAKNAVNETNQVLQVAMADPVYQKGVQGFPEKFYNYSDAFRLWKLVSENRARDLQEAFNLLETQHYYEDQLSIQEEIKSLQQDIAANSKAAASSARVAAVSSTVSAMNSFK